jgi:hypothetical protein
LETCHWSCELSAGICRCSCRYAICVLIAKRYAF